MEIEISDKKRKLNHIGFIVSGWMYQRKYAQIVQLYKELVENGTIEPIEHINRIEDADVEFLIFKFFIAFDKMKEEGLPIPYNEDDILP